jgi:hypothetical protein
MPIANRNIDISVGSNWHGTKKIEIMCLGSDLTAECKRNELHAEKT